MNLQPAFVKVCPHEHTVLNTTGSMHFYAGEVWDDIRTQLICADCGKVLESEEDQLCDELFEIA